MTKHFIDISDYSTSVLTDILKSAARLKEQGRHQKLATCTGYNLGLFFQKPSLRTRMSFELGMKQLGGDVVQFRPDEFGLGERESVKDFAKVVSRYVDCLMLRTFEHSVFNELTEHASIPIINGLSDKSHPCQIMADLLTIQETVGQLNDIKVTYLGDINNITYSLQQAAELFGFQLIVCSPDDSADYQIENDAQLAVSDAQVVYTDTWVSMGQAKTKLELAAMKKYQVTPSIMSSAAPDAIFMHCLPAHRNEEVTDAVIDSEASVVYQQAENRLHAQKALLLFLLEKTN